MITLADAELLERDAELDALRTVLAGARDGRGGIAVVEAPAGQGKTSLLRAVRAEAGAVGLRVLSAVGAELERDYAFGVVRQLFLGPLRTGGQALLEGPASGALPVLHSTFDPALEADVCHARLHALYWLAIGLAEQHPLAIVLDDAHWADESSLRALGVLARRLEDAPIALVIGMRPAERDTLDALAGAPGAATLHPEPLSGDAVARLLGDVAPEFAAAATETTGGNPLLVRELRRTLTAAGFSGTAAEAEAVRRVAPGSITRMVQARLRRLCPEALALARAVAVFERSTLSAVNALAQLDDQQAAAAHATLARAGLLEPGALQFTHPMMREATLAGLVPAERSMLRRRAAELLAEAGAPQDEIAAQLLGAEPTGDPWAATVLADAGRRALAAGDPHAALRHLRRAQAEADRPHARLALGLAAARAGEPDAAEALADAARAEDPEIAARAEQARARVLVMSGRAREAAAALQSGLERARGELAAELEDDLLDALNYQPDLAAERRRRLAAADPRPVVLAHRAFDRAAAGAPAADVIDLARRALAGGALLARGGVERPGLLYAIEALMAVEAADEARAAIEAAADAARRAGSSVGAGAVAKARARWEHEFGHLDAARDAARAAMEIQGALAGADRRPATAALAAALLDGGDLVAAERALAGESALPSRGFHALRGRLHLARGRASEAIADLELERRRGWSLTLREPTAATLVSALAEAGRVQDALALAAEELQRARDRGLAGAEARLLIARARLALARDEELATLQSAATAARRSPSALIQAEALAALGAALRRAGRRSEARDPLREARELALNIGAHGLEARAHEELVIAGARPQRVAQAGVEGLTPSERRVAQLAAAGRRNREIAEELFVTLKTVEVHLGRAYGKLGIGGRSQLASALAP